MKCFSKGFMMTEFYYNRKKLKNWAIVSLIILLIALGFTATTLHELLLVSIIKIVALVSALAAFYVYLQPQKLAQIDKEGIIIDHNAKLKWEDIEAVERLGCRCCCCAGRKFLRFKLKKGVVYPLTWMQKISATSKYGAFSIPLYAMTKEDGEAIEKEIDKYLNPQSEPKAKAKKKTAKKLSKPASKKTTAKKSGTKKATATKK